MTEIKLKTGEILTVKMDFEESMAYIDCAKESNEKFVWLEEYYLALDQIVYLKREEDLDQLEDTENVESEINEDYKATKLRELAQKIESVEKNIFPVEEMLKNVALTTHIPQPRYTDFNEILKK